MLFVSCRSSSSLSMGLVNGIFISILYCCASVVSSSDVDVTSISESLLCRRCGHEVTSTDQLENIGSKLALRQRNDTILGDKPCLIQLFKNPNGHHFELITAKTASIMFHGKAYLDHSWFPDFAWRVGVCPQCGAHLGWSFENPNHSHDHDEKNSKHTKETTSEENKEQNQYSFVGLIFPNLIQQNYADSLIITPKAYRD